MCQIRCETCFAYILKETQVPGYTEPYCAGIGKKTTPGDFCTFYQPARPNVTYRWRMKEIIDGWMCNVDMKTGTIIERLGKIIA